MFGLFKRKLKKCKECGEIFTKTVEVWVGNHPVFDQNMRFEVSPCCKASWEEV